MADQAPPPGHHAIKLDNGDTYYVPDRYGPEETTRLQNEYNRINVANASNQVPTGANPGDPNAQLAYPDPDPSKSDSYLNWGLKNLGAAARGTASGVAQGADYLINTPLGDTINNDIRLWSGDKPLGKDEYVEPVKNWFDSWAPSSPEGSTYDTTHRAAEIVGPVLATEVATAGMGTPELAPAALARLSTLGKVGQVAKVAGSSLIKGGAKTGVIVPAAIGGATVGRGVGEMADEALGTETLGDTGELLGGATVPAGVLPATQQALSKLTTHARSADILAAAKRLNVPATMGLVGRKGIGVAEDVTARGVISGNKAMDARRALYEGLEQSIIDAASTIRGRRQNNPNAPPQPSTGQISMETLGQESTHMANQLIEKARKNMDAVSRQLEVDVGVGTPVDPKPYLDILDNIIKNPTTHDAAVVAHAQKLRSRFQKNMPFVLDAAGNPIKNNAGEYILQDPSYRATKEFREEHGKGIKRQEKKGGGGTKLGVSKEAYGGLTEAMRGAAMSRGITADDFDARQAEIAQDASDKKAAKEITKGKTERERGNVLFGGQRQRSLDQFDPFVRQTPDTLAPIMANALELRLRGEGNAGIPEPKPETFQPKEVYDNWMNPDSDYRDAYSGGMPGPRHVLDDAALLALADANRHGKRSAPGQAGSTIGASGLFTGGLAGLLGGAAGFTHSPLAAVAGVVGAPLGAAAINYGVGKMLTDPRVVEAMVHPQANVPAMARRAVTGPLTEGAWQDTGDEAKRRQEQADFRRIMGL